jgi:hypothetical protein
MPWLAGLSEPGESHEEEAIVSLNKVNEVQQGAIGSRRS